MVRTHFVYCPRSGARWIGTAGPRPETAVAWRRYSNGCVHARGILVEIEAAEPRRWWRDDAQIAVRQAAYRVGGLAWDDNGIIRIVVPADRTGHPGRYAADVWRWMLAVRCAVLGLPVPSAAYPASLPRSGLCGLGVASGVRAGVLDVQCWVRDTYDETPDLAPIRHSIPDDWQVVDEWPETASKTEEEVAAC